MPPRHIARLCRQGERYFTDAFTHLRTGAPCRERIGLLNVLLAEAFNLGLS